MGPEADRKEVTKLLDEWSDGRDDAFNELFELVYDDLSRIARIHLKNERPGHTLNTRALVHESYVRLVGRPGAGWRDRFQFFAVASTAMRRILIDYARRHRAEKRGGDRARVTLGDDIPQAERDLHELLVLQEGIDELASIDPRLVQVVDCRFFGGLSVVETASALDTSTRTVERDWKRARAHLYRKLAPPDARDRD